MSSDDLLTAARVADLAGITPGELYSYVERRQAPRPSARVLGRPMWSRDDIEVWLGMARGDAEDEQEPPTPIR